MEDDIPEIEEVEQAYKDEQGDYDDSLYENQQEQQFNADSPFGKIKDSIFTFFNNLLRLKDSSKVANLDKYELGKCDLSVRGCEQLAGLGTLLHNKSYHDYFMQKAEVTLATSMSKKGWLPELVVSQKKFSQRTVQPTFHTQKKGFLGFGGSKSNVEQATQNE